MLPPINFKSWIEEHRHLLKPPVGNQVVYEDTDFIIMVVGGPNARTDFHIDPYEEFFYQLEGEMTLRVLDEGQLRDIPIRAGEIFLLPPNVPHSPQRAAGGVGLVVERTRPEGVLEAFAWYCEGCGNELYRETLQVRSIVDDLPPVFDRFYESEGNRTCDGCGWVMPPRS